MRTWKDLLNLWPVIPVCCLLLLGPVHASGNSPPDSLQGLDIQDRFVPIQGFDAAGRIDALEGTVVVIHRSNGSAYFGREGDTVYENDVLETLPDARCRIRFRNEDVVTMASGTRFGVDTYREQRGREKPRSLFSMLKGKAMFYAMRLFSRPVRDVTVKTPTAVVGVRGTKFGIHVYWVQEQARAFSGTRVAALGDAPGILAQVEPAGDAFTNCFSEDGVLDVNGRTVTPGNMYQGREGRVMPTPPGYVRSFERETSVQGPDGEDAGPGTTVEGAADGEDSETGGADEDEGTGAAAAGEEEPALAASVDTADLVADTTLQETGNETQVETGGGGPDGISQGKIAGRVSGLAMLLVKSDGFPWFVPGTRGPFYSHGPNPLGQGADLHKAYEIRHEGEADYRLYLQETDAAGTQARVTEFDYGTGGNVALATPGTFTYFQGGAYQDANGHSFLEWGWWEDKGHDGKVGESGGNGYFAATRKIWHVEGDRTHPDFIDHLQQQGAVYSYRGEAHGVFVDSSGAPVKSEHLRGDFSCTIDYGTRRISGFHIDASSTHYDVNLSGSGRLDANGDLAIEQLSGTLNGQASQDGPTGAGGAVCGPRAEGVAGDWQAHDGHAYWATGEFHGRR